MSKIEDSFLEPLRELSKLLSKTKTESTIIGGLSASLHGRPRFTADIDAVILLDFDEIAHFVKSASKFGFAPRLTDVIQFAQKSHVILLIHKKSGIHIDLSIGLLPFEHEMIKTSKKIKIRDVSFHIPSPEDLIITKAVAHRPKDMEDIRNIVAVQKKLNLKRIRRWVKEFAELLEAPEVYKDLDKILKTKRPLLG